MVMPSSLTPRRRPSPFRSRKGNVRRDDDPLRTNWALARCLASRGPVAPVRKKIPQTYVVRDTYPHPKIGPDGWVCAEGAVVVWGRPTAAPAAVFEVSGLHSPHLFCRREPVAGIRAGTRPSLGAGARVQLFRVFS